jgi:hypothetical protein
MGETALDLDRNAIDVRHNFVVREAENAITVLRQPLITATVMGLPHVVRVSIELDDQIGFPAKKVSEVRSDRHLSTEFPAADFSTGQAAP